MLKKIIWSNIKENKVLSFITLLALTISSTLILTIGMMFSSIREYLVSEVSENIGSYHVIANKTYIKDTSKIKYIDIKDNKSYITFNNPSKAYKYGNKICGDKCIYNKELLSLYGVSSNNFLMKIIILILIVISLFSYLVIKNTFDIRNHLNKKKLSILNTLGMTKKKIICLNIVEAIIFSILSTIISLMISMGLTKGLINIFNEYLEGTIKLTFQIYPIFLIISLIFIISIILLSSFLPALKITKKSILKNINEIDKPVKLKHKKIVFNLLGIEGLMAYTNYIRSKKRYRVISRCIWIGIILFILFYLIFSYINKTIDLYVVRPNYDGEIKINGIYDLKPFIKENNLKDYLLFNKCDIKTKIDKKHLYNQDNYHETINIMLVNYDKNKTFLVNKVKENVIKNDKMSFYDEPFLKENIDLKINENIIQNINLNNNVNKFLTNYTTSSNVVVNVPDIEMYDCEYSTNLIYKGSADLTKLNTEATYFDAKKSLKIVEGIIMGVKTLMFTFIFFILFLIFTSIVSTVISNLNIRKTEIGILKSLGFDNTKFRRMMLCESIFICLKAIIISLVLTILLSKFINYSVNLALQIEYISPFGYWFKFSIYSILLVFGSLLFCFYYFNLKSPIDNINNEKV